MTQVTSRVELVSELLFSGRFAVPWHQRLYDWSAEEVRELLEDIHGAMEAHSKCYFIGSIMLIDSPNTEVSTINDGQQRLVTLSMLVASLCRRFVETGPRNSQSEDLALRALFERSGNQASRLSEASKYRPRIKPPRSDEAKYYHVIRGYDIGTNGRLTEAWNVIEIFVRGMSGRTPRRFFEFLMEQVEVSVLRVPPSVDSNSVFEALNARGKSLDDIDLMRNRFYSYFSETDDAVRRSTINERLEQPLVILRNAQKTKEYFRCYLQCKYGHLKKTRFYREARRHVEGLAGKRPSDYVFDLVSGLGSQDSVELFRVILSSAPTLGSKAILPGTAGKRSVDDWLRELRGYSVSRPLVFALLHRATREKDPARRRDVQTAVRRSLKNLTSFVMRTALTVPKFEPSKFEATFANVAQLVFDGTDIESLKIIDALRESDELGIIDNRRFIRQLAGLALSDNRRALNLLFGINARHQPASDAVKRDKCSLEHVLPVASTYWDTWPAFGREDAPKWIYRIGNMVILPKAENRADAGYNGSYSMKKAAFERSLLQMPKEVAQRHGEWTPDVVQRRSLELAKEAAATWNFFSS